MKAARMSCTDPGGKEQAHRKKTLFQCVHQYKEVEYNLEYRKYK